MVAAAMIRPGCLAIPKRPRQSDNGALGANLVTTRRPDADDAVEVAELVKAAGTLEVNTGYAYVLLCTHFSQTSALAHSDGRLVGCALGYRLPESPDTLFIWQLGVAAEQRRQGGGLRLLDELLRRESLRDVNFFHTTIAPSNAGSRSLFERWAYHHAFNLKSIASLAAVLFASAEEHEAETVYQIGPLREFK